MTSSSTAPVLLSPAELRLHLIEGLRQALLQVAPEAGDTPIVLERPREASHGDFATNLAMQLARALKQNPRAIAQALVAALPASPWVASTEIAGAGFINLKLSPAVHQSLVPLVLQQAQAYGRAPRRGQRAQVEFVSANPTGPLHVGHGRGAAYGASLAALLDGAGWDVDREYYVNDAGRQMDILALSTWLRYLEQHGQVVPFPPNAYQGDYVREMAQALSAQQGAAWVHPAATVLADLPGLAPSTELESAQAEVAKAASARNEQHLDGLIARAKALLGPAYRTLHRHVLEAQLQDCRDDLTEMDVHFECWFSEQSLFDSGLVAATVARLEAAGHIYEQNGARWFRSTAFGDEKDRVVQRDNGIYTYFASDIAYHLNKFERGYSMMVNVWGADHHGYISRVKGALQALGLDTEKLHIPLVQFAVLYRGGEKVQMSTRKGSYVTLRELRGEVGKDATRFFYVLRKSDQHLDFDLDLATSQSNDNPVYYIQYAHARICKVLQAWGGEVATLAQASVAGLVEEEELALLKQLAAYPEVIEAAARDFAPHSVAFYLKELAAQFHAYYAKTRFLVDDAALGEARLALVCAIRQVIQNGMALLGVSCPEQM